MNIQSIQNSVINQLKQLLESEIGDFFAGLDKPGEPASTQEKHQVLLSRIKSIFEDAEKNWFTLHLAWLMREEFNRSLMLQEMSVTSLKALMNFANSQSIASKEYAMNAFSIDDLISYNRLNLDFLNWNSLYTACLNEVNQRGEA
ncbi:hypothetical protein [Shewanella frigidimarina]|uniref:hypothetical protein n=1 Tax=Shewanella frigidimarina TaxID=56812 RepID=UPI003D79CFC6